MKKGTTLLSLTFLSLGVYRFSQSFLVQQVKRVEAADVAVDKSRDAETITGGALNITVKNYPKTDESHSSETSGDQTSESASQTATTTTQTHDQPAVSESVTQAQIQPTAPIAAQSAPEDQSSDAILAGTTAHPQTPKTAKVRQKPNDAQHQPAATATDDSNASRKRREFKKHHAQVEKDIVAFQSSSGSPAPGGSGGASTQVGAVFGELAGHSLFAVRNNRLVD